MGSVSFPETKTHPTARLRPFHASKSIRPPAPPPIQTLECLDLTQSSLVLPLYVHHSLSLALGACLDTGHDRGYTHTVINTVYSPVLQVHQLASNNDLIPPGVIWRARRSRSRPPDQKASLWVGADVHCRYLSLFLACIALGQLQVWTSQGEKDDYY